MSACLPNRPFTRLGWIEAPREAKQGNKTEQGVRRVFFRNRSSDEKCEIYEFMIPLVGESNVGLEGLLVLDIFQEHVKGLSKGMLAALPLRQNS